MDIDDELLRSDDGEGSVDLPTFGGSGLRAGVDLEDRQALAELLDEDSSRRQ